MSRHRRNKHTRWKNAWDIKNFERVSEISTRMAKEHPMRKLEFPTGTRPGTKHKISAVAWASNRRGRVPWKSSNVTTQISEYLHECGYIIDPRDVAYVMQWAHKNKYGYRRTQEGGKRTLEFAFLPDVDLNGHSAEGLDKVRTATAPPPDAATRAGVETLQAVKNGITPATQTAVLTREEAVNANPVIPVNIDVPIPGAPAHADVYRMKELNDLLTKWSDNNPEAYADWVDRSIVQLSAVLG